MSPSVVDVTFRKAFDFWEEHADIRFEAVENSTDVDIVVFFARGAHGDGVSFDGSGRVLAHAWFPNSGGNAGDCHLDEDERWAVGPDGTTIQNLSS